MNRDDVLTVLKNYKKIHGEKYGLIELGLFGSFARSDTGPGSDVNVVVQLSKQDLFHIIGIKQDLEENLHMPVDVVSYRPEMNFYLKKCIDRDAVYV